jgi:hypothetical protein
MQEIDVASWEEFLGKLNDIRSRDQPMTQPILFRGQSNSHWALNTTLDRSNREGMLFQDYYRLISSVKQKLKRSPIQRG